MSILEKVVSYLPLASIVLFFLSIVRLYVFYDFFGINIIPLLTISEVVKSMLDALIPCLIVLLISTLFLSNKIIHYNLETNIDLINEAPQKNTLEQSHTIFYQLCGGSISLTLPLLVLFTTIKFVFFGSEVYYFGIYIMIALMVVSIYFLTKIKKDDFDDLKAININFEIPLYINICFLLISFFSLFGLIEAIIVKKHHGRRNEIIFKMDGKEVKSDLTNIYIGNIENFIVLYNIDSSASTLYHTSDVKEMTFKAKTRSKKTNEKRKQFKPLNHPNKDTLRIKENLDTVISP